MIADLADGSFVETPWYWWVIGFGGQIVFASRFWVQWVASERARKSVIPIAFWHLSLAGGVLSLLYAIYRQDPVFIVGQLTGSAIYARNLYLIRGAAAGEVSPP
ncbi:MAG: lipid-A-disaccharide synthase N-terminal domain-containing protein [Planctomycetes bacterium]|nr:lipid-A-disaccharide synthase N-terminal domain-containing protein [Planctomycetota bacterium]